MSSSVCQGLQSCLESRRVEPRVLRLKLAPRIPSTDSDATAKMKVAAVAEAQPGADAADWSFLHAFANAEEKGEGEQGAVYVHPLVKCSSSFLSDRSLEMCTESLGSETGSDVSNGDAPLLSPGGGRDGYHRPAIQPARKKPSQSRSFPPPLTSVSGSMGVEVRSRREGGRRLVVEAVVVSSPCNFFQVERSHGRLRVRFSEESDAPETEAEEEEDDEDEEEEEVEAESDEAEEEEEEEEEENVTLEGEDFDYEEFEKEEEEAEGKGMEGNSGFSGGEIGNGKCLRPSMVRCKEGIRLSGPPSILLNQNQNENFKVSSKTKLDLIGLPAQLGKRRSLDARFELAKQTYKLRRDKGPCRNVGRKQKLRDDVLGLRQKRLTCRNREGVGKNSHRASEQGRYERTSGNDQVGGPRTKGASSTETDLIADFIRHTYLSLSVEQHCNPTSNRVSPTSWPSSNLSASRQQRWRSDKDSGSTTTAGHRWRSNEDGGGGRTTAAAYAYRQINHPSSSVNLDYNLHEHITFLDSHLNFVRSVPTFGIAIPFGDRIWRFNVRT
ncbi:hypothetical protein NL676_023297 [Syzygium grande]|nr:hypothetical protein NL676_023297 [Syzygium grande]